MTNRSLRTIFLKLPVIMLTMTLAAGCQTGLNTQMRAILDNLENDLGYVNTVNEEDARKLASWFETKGSEDEAARALFFLGRTQFNQGSYSSAIVSYTQALDHSTKTEDRKTEARICSDMARTFASSGNTTDQIIYLGRAAEAFKDAGMDNECQLSLLEIGRVQANLGKDEAAEEIFKSVLAESHEKGDTLLEVRCLEAYADLCVSSASPDPMLAIDLLSRASDDLRFPLTCSDKGILAYSFSLLGEKENARRWLSEASSMAESDEEAAMVKFRDYQISSREGSTATALASLEKVLEYENKSQALSLETAVEASQREYIQSQKEAQSEKLRAARLKLWVLALGAVLLIAAAAVVLAYYRNEEKKKIEAEKAEREKYMSIAEDLKSKLARSINYDALERLCEQYYIYEGTDNLKPKILKEVKSIVEGLRSDRKTQKDLEKMLDDRMDGVIRKLRLEFPSWKEDSILLYCFAAAGFSSTTISTLMEKDKSVIYNRIWRLKGRISSSESPLKDFFLECLGD